MPANLFVKLFVMWIPTKKYFTSLTLSKLKQTLQSGIHDAEHGIYVDYTLDALIQDMHHEYKT